MRKPYSIRRLQQFAIAISTISIIYNGAEGAISIGFGSESSSKSLIFFGIQSLIEVVSAALVLWRFAKVARPGDEKAAHSLPSSLIQRERYATIDIGLLFAVLTAGTWTTSIIALVRREQPQTATPGIIISASALGIMVLIWAPKPWLAKALNSSAMHGEAMCSLACISMTAVLLAGTIIYKFWEGGWWVDSATAIILGFFFARDAFEMIRWGMSKQFSGGCCGSCQPVKRPTDMTARVNETAGCSATCKKGSCQQAKPPPFDVAGTLNEMKDCTTCKKSSSCCSDTECSA
jgi:divalent metal cation (Fe/Co/Zn/Cd) transporter